jgi:hypothetical protein
MRLVVLALAAACGSSNRPATTTTAGGAGCPSNRQAMFELALSVARETYDVAKLDVAATTFVTEPNWYTPDGGPRDEAAIADGDLRAGLRVEVDDRAAWHVAPIVERHRDGALVREVIAPGEPAMPAWARGMAEGLSADIDKQCRR